MFSRSTHALLMALVLVPSLAVGAVAAPTKATTAAAAATPAVPATPAPYSLPYAMNAQPNVSPTAPPKPGKIQISGKIRAYDFDRVNHVQNASNPNRHAFAAGADPHVGYRIGDSNFILGYTYAASYGFGLDGPNPVKNAHIDNSLPGFPVNVPLHEAYLQYHDQNTIVTAGNQELNYFWTPESDSRIVPFAYQALDGSFKLAKNLNFGITRIVRFQARNSSNFEDNTLLTAPYPGTSSLFTKSNHTTPGALRTALSYKPTARFALNAENYEFYNLSNLAYVEGRYGVAPTSRYNPYVAMQFVAENSLGQNQIGRINNHTIGVQLGATVVKNITLALSADTSPWQYALVHATSTAAAGANYFLPSGGTGTVQKIGTNYYKVAYGGIASPYTDSYASDPLYTTMITQGMVDRRSAGNSYKAALAYTSSTKQLRLSVAEADFQYSNQISRNLTSEFNVDGSYYFNKVRSGPYHGFLARVRFAPRTIPAIPYNFQYQRFQTEYDF